MQAARCSFVLLLVFAVAFSLYTDPAHADQLVYVALPKPCRLLDTRAGTGTGTPLTAGSPYLLGTDDTSIASPTQHGSSTGCGIPVGIEAISVSMNMLDASAAGSITTWNPDSGSTAPNIGTGVYNPQVTFNTGYSTIPVGAQYVNLFTNPNAGKFYLQAANGQTDMTINIVGYWLPMSWNEVRSGTYSTALGYDPTASGYNSISIGTGSIASGADSIAMGTYATASGYDSTALGGYRATASGQYSTAMGTDATNTNGSSIFNNAFVYGDGSSATANTADYQFMVRASGGVVFYTSNGTAGAQLAAGSGSWTNLSDRDAKSGLQTVDTRSVLERVLALPMSTWRYKTQDAKYRHMGPMAQDFYAAFHLGETDKGIDDIDAQGVALAAIQGLNAELQEKVSEKDREIAALHAELRTQNARIAAQDMRLASLESVASDVAELKAQLATMRKKSSPAVTTASLQP